VIPASVCEKPIPGIVIATVSRPGTSSCRFAAALDVLARRNGSEASGEDCRVGRIGAADGDAARGEQRDETGIMLRVPRGFVVTEVMPGSERLEVLLDLADSVLAQARYIVSEIPTAFESHVLGAFDASECVGFLRYIVQVIGSDAGRPPVVHDAVPLTEGFVEAFGVAPGSRRRGIGSALQAGAQERCRALGCHQMRSRSPVTSIENYALKVDAGYVLHPSKENDSYYFLLKL